MDFIKKMKRLMNCMKSYTKLINISIVTGTLNRFLSVGIVTFSSYIAGLSLSNAPSYRIKSFFIPLIILGLTKALMAYLEMYYVHKLAYGILFDYRNIMYKKISDISPAYMLKERTGNVAATVMEDVEQLEVFYAHTVTAYIVSIIASIILCILIGKINIYLLYIVIPSLILIFLIPYFFKNISNKIGSKVRIRLAEIHADIIDALQGMREILIFDQKDNFVKKIEKKSDELGKVQIKQGKIIGWQTAIISIVMSAALIAIVVIANRFYGQGMLDKKWIPTISILAVNIFVPAVGVSNTATSLGIIEAASDRIFKILNTNREVEDTVPYDENLKLEPCVEFKDVDFSYEDGIPVLNKINFKVDKGEKVVLVGSSGAGKSTCINLLLRFWDVDSGSINIGGVDIRDISIKNIREYISFVSQDVYLFNLSVKENIALGMDNIDDEKIIGAAKAAFAHDFIMELPNGYDTIIGERGVRLSGGQRQRIAIARALIKDSPILLLDEAVSNLDTKNEKLVEEAIQNLSAGRTIITIAHRAATIKNADRIIVIREGQVVEDGTHKELIKNDGVYKSLIREVY